MPNQLTDSHIDEIEERGYVIVHNFLDEEQRKRDCCCGAEDLETLE